MTTDTSIPAADKAAAPVTPPAVPASGAVTPPSNNPVTRPDNVPEKFWDAEKGTVNTEALLKSYSELETKQSKPAEVTPEQQDALNADAKAADAALKGSGLSLTQFTEEYAANGVLSAESYATLEAAGFPKDFVDSHIEGQIALGNTFASAAFEAAGSEAAYKTMVEWAKTAMSPAEIDTFNKGVMGKMPDMLKAVKTMRERYESATGKEPALLQGGNGAKGDVFTSQHEAAQAMKDKRWGKDPAYTKQITEKLNRSTY